MADAAESDHAASTVNRTNLTACYARLRESIASDMMLYVLSLEQRIEYLEACLERQRGPQEDGPLRISSSTSGQGQQSPEPWGEPLFRVPNSDPLRHVPPDTELPLTLAPATATHTERTPTSLQISGLGHGLALSSDARAGSSGHHIDSDVLHDLDASRLSLPSWEASQNLIKSYFQFANLSQPVLYEPHFRQMAVRLYSLPPDIDLRTTHARMEIKTDLFFVLEVFAVALLVLQKQEPSRIPTSVADRYHRVALSALTGIGVPTSVLGVQALLLASQYFYHHPVDWEVWKSVGAAVRLAVEIGLHEDPGPHQQMDFLTRDIRRRTFWVAYAMDRNLAIALGKPTALADSAISAQFPSALEDDFITADGPNQPAGHQPGPKAVNIHLLRFRQIQSEMQSILRQKTPPGHSKVDVASWQADMHQRIRSWYDQIPRTSNPSSYERKVIENFDLTYYRALLYLYQPQNEHTEHDEATILMVANAVIQIIALYRKFFDERRLTIYWQAIENLASAGSALLHTYLRSAAVQDEVSRVQLQRHVQTCSSLLWAMVEHFPAFRAKRDIFDETAAQVLAALSSCVADAQPMGNNDTLAQVNSLCSTDELSNIRSEGNIPVNESVPHVTTGINVDAANHLGRSNAVDIATPSYADFESAAFDWDAIGTIDDNAFASWL